MIKATVSTPCPSCGHHLTRCDGLSGYCSRCGQWQRAETITAKPDSAHHHIGARTVAIENPTHSLDCQIRRLDFPGKLWLAEAKASRLPMP